MVTGVKFLFDRRFLVSSSKDTLLKVWDMNTQHCIQTVVGHRTEIWSFDLNSEGTRLVASSAGRTLRVYAINFRPENPMETNDSQEMASQVRKHPTN